MFFHTLDRPIQIQIVSYLAAEYLSGHFNSQNGGFYEQIFMFLEIFSDI